MNIEQFKKMKKENSVGHGWYKKLTSKLEVMKKDEVIEFDFGEMTKSTFMRYIERFNRYNKPEKHFAYLTKPCRTGAFIARDI